MKTLGFLLLLLATLIGLVAADDVIVLTESNFDAEVMDKDFIVVEFYAPWCGHCKHLEPEWSKAATILKNNDPPLYLAKVDATEHGALASRFGVNGYPTIKIFRNGKDETYSGPRDAPGIVKFLKGQAGPVSKTLTTAEELEKLIQYDLAVVAYLPEDSTELRRAFMDCAAALITQFTFAHTSDPAVFGQHVTGLAAEAKIVLLHSLVKAHPKHDEMAIEYSGPAESESIEAFVKNNALPLVAHTHADTENRLTYSGLPVLTVYSAVNYAINPQEAKYVRNRLIATAQAHKGKLHVALADKKEYVSQLVKLGLLKCEPACAVISSKDDNYVMQGDYSPRAVASFAADFLAGKVERYIKSEAPPASNDGPVKIVTGKTFDEIVLDESKDVLIELYAPWCGHCKSLAPKWDELGAKLKNNPNVIVAKMDATANEGPSQFSASGYPTIYWAPHDQKASPVKYTGPHEVADFVKFIKKNSKLLTNHDEL